MNKVYSNFERKMKFMGVICYEYVIYIMIIFVGILKLCQLFNATWTVTIYILTLTLIPAITLFYTMSSSKDENKYAILNLIKYMFSTKRYLYTQMTKIEYVKSVVKSIIK